MQSKYNKPEYANYPWVFWFKISIRTKWFSYWWQTRGANSLELQRWIFKISIGRPWLIGPMEAHQMDFGSAKHIHAANKANRRHLISFKMKSPIKK